MARFSASSQSLIDSSCPQFCSEALNSTSLYPHCNSNPRPSEPTSAVSWRNRMPVHLATERASSHVPILSPTVEEVSGGIDAILDGELRPAHTPSSTSTIRAPSSSSAKFLPPASPQAQLHPRSGALHFHTDSTSTSASESAGSSPTTAPSLSGSVHNSETPTTSPDTPASNQFSAASGSPTITLASRAGTFEQREPVALPRPAPVDLPRPSTGIKGKRNLKNLAVDTSSATAFGRAISTASLPLNRGDSSSMLTGAPTPAVFNKQPKFLKNKRSTLGLTLVTPSSGGSNKNSDDANHVVPPTPSLVRPHALRHFPSSPSLLIRSPTGQPQEVQLSGMESLNSALINSSGAAVGFHPPPTTEEEDEINFDVPQSQEPKVETYPDGPICIYDPHVYLYYEPTAEQATTFDVIFNVAEEVPNPFRHLASAAHDDDGSAETPKASTPLYREPEYFHIPWQHNTDIVPELYNLSTLIDDRVKMGKRILIHCQCGVSRSASLIVAYGLYKNPSMTVQEAYDAVKRRSKWINPNMSLIMQLQEFRSQQLKTSAGMPTRGLRLKSPGQVNVRSPLDSAHSRSRSAVDAEDAGPKSAPLDSNQNAPSLSEMAPTDLGAVSPGPSSAPSGFPWPSDRDADLDARDSGSNYATPLEVPLDRLESVFATQASTADSQRPVSQPLSPPRIEKRPAPLKLPQTHLARFQASNAKQIAESPRATEFSMASTRPPPAEDMFGLTSPHAAPPSFSAAPSQTFPFPPAAAAPAPRPVPLASVPEQSLPSIPIEPLFSPRGQEFGMKALNSDPLADETFGLTSPRTDTFATTSLPHPTPAAAPQISQRHIPLDRQPPPMPLRQAPPPPVGIPLSGGLFSPRSHEFGMNALKLQDDQDTFGLTSPRFGSFAPQLPQRSSSRATAISALHPEPPTPQNTQQKAGDRAKLRSKLGMSTSSSYDMRSEYVLAAKARELRPTLPSQDSFQRILQAQDDLSDALMSPRATEFTSNPFRETFPSPETQAGQVDNAATTTPRKADPRSPAQKGASPIIRNIFDVIS